ncbi:dehydrodolichyl diphosphate synthase complex subunit Nus1-like [Haliotis asinina]|uniref:dehydrodolichyl diphosphate synthase complex subunit Nus1-like n=1 Tax=Haliotis asinina TaxID=109174 RepID=UPI0035324FF5
MLRTVLLQLIHCLLGLGVFLRQIIFQFPLAYSVLGKKTAITKIRSDAKSLKKLPLHVGVVVVENEYSYSDLANIIVWSVAFGISYISVYDINGEIKRNSFLLQSEVQKSKEHILASDQNKFDVDFHSKNSSEKKDGGCSNIKQIRVRLLSLNDGRQNLVEMTQSLSKLVAGHQYRLEDIVPSTVDALLQDAHKFPDPDLVLRCGPVDSLLGYLPWEIRLSEILSISSHWNISYKTYLSLVSAYGDTTQRFGK